MLKSFRYRLYPTRRQLLVLEAQLDECRWLYNQLLEQRKTTYEKTQKSLGLFAQQASILKFKESRPTLKTVHSQVLQNVAVRIDLAFKAFFRRVQAGEKPGYPRFKAQGRYDSMTFPQVPSGCELKGNRLHLSKIGTIRLVLHRKIEGVAKTCTLRRSSTGKWYVCFSSELPEPKPLKRSKKEVGIDVGLESFATFSTGERTENPKFFRSDEKALAQAQRKLSKAEKGSSERRQRRKVVARIYERIHDRRLDFAHRLAHSIVQKFGVIAVEDLKVNRMVHEHCTAKSMMDAAWGLFFTVLLFKAAEAGRALVKVNPAYTSQDCSHCGHRQPMPLGVRKFRCPCCGLVLHRDHNAAINILGLGRQSLGLGPRSPQL